jgi:hypothetical protein
VDAEDEYDEMDAFDVYPEYIDPSVDRAEFVLVRSAPSCSCCSGGGAEDPSKDWRFVEDRSARDEGGTSWTCRLRGWFDFAGGGRTNINVFYMK